jgi:cytochrome c biogenesis protein CcdA
VSEPTKRRSVFESQIVICRECGHPLSLRHIPLPEEQVAIVRRKRLVSSLTIVLGVAMLLVGLQILYSHMPDYLLYFAILMVVGVAVTFAGVDTLLFGYETHAERIERQG